MKKLLAIALAMLMAVSATACSNGGEQTNDNGNSNTQTEKNSEVTENNDSESGRLILDNNSVVGVWMVDPEYVKENSNLSWNDKSTEESTKETTYEQNTFIIFTDDAVEGGAEGHKVAKLKCGTAEYVGSYIAEDNEDGTKTVLVSISYFFSGNFTQSELSGNVFTGKELKLKDDNNNTLSLVSASLPNITVAVSEDFKVNEKLVGEWTDGEYGYVFKFNADGTVYVDLGGSFIMEGVYTYDDEKITVTYIQTDEIDEVYSYEFSGEKLLLDGLEFVKET